MGRVVLDSSVLIALLVPKPESASTMLKLSKAIESSIQNKYSISSISLLEVLVHPYRQSQQAADFVTSNIFNWVDECVDVDNAIASKAASIRALTGLKTPEAIISATAILTGSTLWTTDVLLAKHHTGEVWNPADNRP